MSLKDHAPKARRLEGGDFSTAVGDCCCDVLGFAICAGIDRLVGFELEGVGVCVDK